MFVSPGRSLVQDLISYQPTLAGCTATDLSVVNNCKPEHPEAISGCGISGFSPVPRPSALAKRVWCSEQHFLSHRMGPLLGLSSPIVVLIYLCTNCCRHSYMHFFDVKWFLPSSMIKGWYIVSSLFGHHSCKTLPIKNVP